MSPLVVNAEKAAVWAVLKVLGRGAVEDLCDNPWKLRVGVGGREGREKSVYLDRLKESGYAAQSTHTLHSH